MRVFLRATAAVAVVVGAVGSLVLLLREGRSTPRLLLIAFVFWVLAPFAALVWANLVSQRWSALTRATLFCLSLVITLGALAAYGKLILPPAGSARAFMFVMVPAASWLLIAIVAIGEFMSRKRQHGGDRT